MMRVDREAAVVMSEAVTALAFRATNALYDEQPELWKMGERGRARTLEDFGHHFEALTTLDGALFSDHVRYCQTLFRNLGFPSKWLDDAWRIMADTLTHELPPAIAEEAIRALRAGSDPMAGETQPTNP